MKIPRLAIAVAFVLWPLAASAQQNLTEVEQAVVAECRALIRQELEQLVRASFEAGQSKRGNIISRMHAGSKDREAEALIARLTERGEALVIALLWAHSGQLAHQSPEALLNWTLTTCGNEVSGR